MAEVGAAENRGVRVLRHLLRLNIGGPSVHVILLSAAPSPGQQRGGRGKGVGARGQHAGARGGEERDL